MVITTFVAASFSTGKDGVQVNNCARRMDIAKKGNKRKNRVFFIASVYGFQPHSQLNFSRKDF